MTISLADIEESIKSEIKINSNGVGYVTIRGAARLAFVSDKSLRAAFASAEGKPSRLSKFLAQYGFGAEEQKRFATDMMPDKAVALIVNYYAMHAENYCTYEARFSVLAFSTIGIRTWLQRSVGYVDPQQVVLNNPALKEPIKGISDEQKLASVLQRFLKYCKSEAKTTGFFGSGHCLVRRKDVLSLFGKKGKKYLNKPEILKLFLSAEAGGLGTVVVDDREIYTFTPFTNFKLFTT